MAKAVSTKVTKAKKGDTESKGRGPRGAKRTSIGKSGNSRAKNKNAVRAKKGRP
ncbi:MAG: hypothetical protein PHY48_15130 [Candidatus Cloacimonetes bacterium]|nr:hypothetical protein [Candidatus Cloacimonadota bacterium]